MSRARYGKPLDVWRTALGQGRKLAFDLGAEDELEREHWQVYAPETEHERRTRANNVARATLVRWFRKPDSPRAREAFIGTAFESVQFRRLMLRYGLDGRDPMKLEDIAEKESVRRPAVERAIAAALSSLPPLPTAVEHSRLQALAATTAGLAEQGKFVGHNELEDAPLSTHYVRSNKIMEPIEWDSIRELADELGGPEREALLSGGSNWSTDPDDFSGEDIATARRKFGTVIRVDPHGTSWASDINGRASLMDAYTDGWIACNDGAGDTSCPFRNRKLRKKWHQGYREAVQELAARREASNS